MGLRYCFLFLALLNLLGFSLARADVFISLRDSAEVDQAAIRLSDIAEITAKYPEEREYLGGLIVAHCPNLTALCHLHMNDIAVALQSQSGIRVFWGGNETVAVRGRKHSFSLLPAIESVAIRLVRAMDQGQPLSVGTDGRLTSVNVPPGTVDVRPDFKYLRWVRDSIELPLDVVVEGGYAIRPIIVFTVQRQRSIQSATPTTPDSRKELKAVSSSSRYSQKERQESDAALNTNSLSRTLVGRNKEVRIRLVGGPVEIETDGIALADAGLGEYVNVRRTNGPGGFRGRVVERGVVVVEEGGA